eukprot:2957178-Rhodomonas_salina.1
MSHGRKCWLAYSPRLNWIFATCNVTFDDTLFPLRDSDQRVYGYYDNAAITQLRADAYGPGIDDTPFTDILRMPLPGDPSTTSIDSNFDSLTDLEISSSGVPDLNVHDVHPAINQSRHVTGLSQSHADVTSLRGGCIVNRGGCDVSPDNSTGDRGGSVPYLLPAGSKRVHYAIQGPSAGLLKAARRNCFAPPVPELGQSPKHWWDCESKEISQVTDSELGEYLIGHSVVFPVPGAYWP